MEDPEKEIEDVVLTITSAINPEIQKAAFLRYFAPDASFRHPLCTVPSSSVPSSGTPHPTLQSSPSLAPFARLSRAFSPTGFATSNSRDTILRVYQWYRVISSRIVIHIEKVFYDASREEMYLEIVQTLHIRWNPFPPAQSRLVTHINLRKLESPPDTPEGRPLYVIAAQEDFYHPEDLLVYVLPTLVPLLHIFLLLGTWACVIGAWLGSALGYWSVKQGEGGRGVALEPTGEDPPPASSRELNAWVNGNRSSPSTSDGEQAGARDQEKVKDE